MRSPSVGPIDRFGRQPEYPQVLDGLHLLDGLIGELSAFEGLILPNAIRLAPVVMDRPVSGPARGERLQQSQSLSFDRVEQIHWLGIRHRLT
jgi:hypothetical protein